MTISRILGATMVAGALATTGAVAGIAGAAASPASTSTVATTTTPSTTPSTPAPTQKSGGPPTGSQGRHSCPNMGSGSTGATGSSGPNSGASYPGAAAGASYQ